MCITTVSGSNNAGAAVVYYLKFHRRSLPLNIVDEDGSFSLPPTPNVVVLLNRSSSALKWLATELKLKTD